jgi:predicted nicotinamide N-methyase
VTQPRATPRADGLVAAADERQLRARFVVLDPAPSPPDGIIVYEAKDPGLAFDLAIARGEPAPYGAVLWDSACDLARQLFRADLAGRRFLEVGCGCGLVGLVAARRGAAVLCTDIDRHALVAVARGAEDARVEVAVDTFDLLSAAPLPQVGGENATDVVLSDVLYEGELAASAARRALEALALGARVFVGDPDRAGRHAFTRLLADRGVTVVFHGAVCVLTPERP